MGFDLQNFLFDRIDYCLLRVGCVRSRLLFYSRHWWCEWYRLRARLNTLKRFFNWLDHLENEVEPGGFVFDHVNDISKTMQTFSRSRFIILSLISAKSDSIVRTLKTKSRFIIFPNFFPRSKDCLCYAYLETLSPISVKNDWNTLKILDYAYIENEVGSFIILFSMMRIISNRLKSSLGIGGIGL